MLEKSSIPLASFLNARVSRVLFAGLGLALVALQLAGCSTTPGPSAGSIAKDDPFAVLEKDMPEEKVRELVGPPKKVEPMRGHAEVRSEIWTYERSLPGRVRQVVSGMQEMVGYDPITSQEYKYSVPVYSNQTDFVTETIELLMIDGKFAERRRSADRRATFH